MKEVLKQLIDKKARFTLYDAGEGEVIVRRVKSKYVVVDIIEDTWTACYPNSTISFPSQRMCFSYFQICELTLPMSKGRGFLLPTTT